MSTAFSKIVNIAGAELPTLYDIASVLDMSDIEGNVTPQPFTRWQYRRAPFTVPSIETVAERADNFIEGEWADDFTYAQIQLAVAVRDGEVSQADLIYAGDVLDKYTSILRRAGKDY